MPLLGSGNLPIVVAFIPEPILQPKLESACGRAIGNLAVILLHASYRVPLHGFVYPNGPTKPVLHVFRFFLLGNFLNDLWLFWTIVGIGQLIAYHSRSIDRERELSGAQLQALAAQLRPHFFFNVLNSVSALMHQNVQEADNMIVQLGDLMRTTLKRSADQETSVRDEIDLVRTYMEIESIRFRGRLSFTVAADKDVLDAAVPALILLPLVENSVRYAIAKRSERGTIVVSANRLNADLIVKVTDDGPGVDLGPGFREGIGLSSTRTRLQRHHPRSARFAYQNLADGGFEVGFRIPLVALPSHTYRDGHGDRYRRIPHTQTDA
jgi:two-component sensor histidine kinase